MSTDRLAVIKARYGGKRRFASEVQVDIDYLIARVEALEKVREAAELTAESHSHTLRPDLDDVEIRDLRAALDAAREGE